MHIVVGRGSEGVMIQRLSDDGADLGAPEETRDLPALVRRLEKEHQPRWVWSDTARWYPGLLEAGVRVARAFDLRLNHAILRRAEAAAGTPIALAAPGEWDAVDQAEAGDDAVLFELAGNQAAEETALFRETRAELSRQLAALAASHAPGGLRLLLAAESAGALLAAELRHAGLPWDAAEHDAVLTHLLGPRVPAGARPQRLQKLAQEIRAALQDAALNPDSPQELLASLRRAGLLLTSTRAWELRRLEHPVREPLLEYKKLARLLAANGWVWLDAWVRDGRFRADYLPGAVVTGRWATRGGGALQLPAQVRSAVRADSGWKLVVADAAQLEPRILAALSGDMAMALAGRGSDLYAGIVASGAVETRAQAKVAMLGAMYGATTGESGRLLPRLAAAYPRAIALVEAAARAGERGEKVSSRLGRSSPQPPASWFALQQRASAPDASAADERRARSGAREWGRFTRNFVVQSTAAEWALCWLAGLRTALAALAPDADPFADPFTDAPHLVFFLHDEVVVHTPARHADAVADAVRDAAAAAGRLLFGDFPVDFPLGVAVVDSYADAKAAGS